MSEQFNQRANLGDSPPKLCLISGVFNIFCKCGVKSISKMSQFKVNYTLWIKLSLVEILGSEQHVEASHVFLKRVD